MLPIGPDTTADLFFQLTWHSRNVRHTDTYAAHMVNFWRDRLPRQLYDDLMQRQAGDRLEWRLAPGELLGNSSLPDVRRLKRTQFDPTRVQGRVGAPCPGRFYPKGVLADVANVFTVNKEPFRCLEVDQEQISVDMGHPLTGKAATLNVTVGAVSAKIEERGGGSHDWMETLSQGPGMQARWGDHATDFFSIMPFARQDETPDDLFYAKPRLVQHIDDTAAEMVRQFYERLLAPDTRILDLMGSWDSHLPLQRAFKQVSALGLNALELAKNNALNDFEVHDLNQEPVLPYADDHFDAVICTVSVEYLIHPWAVFAQAARVLRPGGRLIITFSNRWFPPKAIAIWSQLHEFERMGLVLEYFHRTASFTNLQTYSVRGLIRPRHDKYFGEIPFSDPVYAVWGQKIG